MGGSRNLEGDVRAREHPSIELACDRARDGSDLSPPSLALERTIARHFPNVAVRTPSSETLRFSLRRWCAPSFDPQRFDELLARGATRGALRIALELDGPTDVAGAVLQILTRAQPYLDRRNRASRTETFERALTAHFALHDLDQELVRADYAHALDTWQWTLRLDPDASLALQLAALFHDVERLVSEPLIRIEQHAADYVAFKRAHARRGAELTAATLGDVGLPPAIVQRVTELIATHESAGADPEAALLNDADALSFFSRNSAGFADYYGPKHTRTKVRYTYLRASPRALNSLATVRLRSDIASLLAEVRQEVPR